MTNEWIQTLTRSDSATEKFHNALLQNEHPDQNVQLNRSNYWLTIWAVQQNWSTILDKMVPPMVEALLFPVKLVPLEE